MKFPTKLKVGGHWYKVICPYKFTERGDRSADHDADNKIIRIDNKDSWSHTGRRESSMAVDFLHEIFHACNQQSGYTIWPRNEEEEKICITSEILFQILRDNKLHFDDKT